MGRERDSCRRFTRLARATPRSIDDCGRVGRTPLAIDVESRANGCEATRSIDGGYRSRPKNFKPPPGNAASQGRQRLTRRPVRVTCADQSDNSSFGTREDAFCGRNARYSTPGMVREARPALRAAEAGLRRRRLASLETIGALAHGAIERVDDPKVMYSSIGRFFIRAIASIADARRVRSLAVGDQRRRLASSMAELLACNVSRIQCLSVFCSRS